MKFCPTCQREYDEEILRFCMKDGTPLVEKAAPNFIEMPSESLESPADDFGEETVIRRKTPTNPIPPPPPEVEETFTRNSAERIVIPTIEDKRDQQVRTRTGGAYQPPPAKSNTAKVVLLTILGTIFVLGAGAGVFWLLQKDTPTAANTNANTNLSTIDTNTNSNLNIGNFDFNVNANAVTNLNTNANVNANLKTPTPTPKPSPSPTASPSPAANANTNTNVSNANVNTNSATPRPSPTVSPRTSPTPARTPNTNTAPANRPVNSGVLNGRAISLPKPAYPSTARAVRASGSVTVQISLDEGGNVISAKAVSGHPLLRQPAESSARQARFAPVRVGNQAVPSNGILVYTFVAN